MASRAGKAAALASIGRDIPNIFSTVLGTYRSGVDRKEAQKDRELDRELMGYQMEGVKKDLTAKDLQNQLTGMNVEQKKAGADALRQFYESLDDEKKLAELKDLTAKNIAKLDNKEKSFTDADTNLAEITTQAKPENFEQKRRDIAERFQFVNPEAQGLMTGIKQKEDAAAKAEQDALDRERALFDANTRFEQQKQLYGIKTEGQKEVLETKAGLAPPKEPKPISTGVASDITKSAQAVDLLSELKNMVSSGDASYTQTSGLFGNEFTNPKLNNALTQLSELHGREQSGAAISPSEWKSFRNQIMNPKFLLTDDGKKAALENIDDFLTKYYTKGAMVSGNENWYEDHTKTKKSVKEKFTATSPKAQAGGDELDQLLFGGN